MEPNSGNAFAWIVAEAPKHRAARELAALQHRRVVNARQADAQQAELLGMAIKKHE